jgi:hypothetical protein
LTIALATKNTAGEVVLVGSAAGISDRVDATLLEVTSTLFTERIVECFGILIISDPSLEGGAMALPVEAILQLVGDFVFIKHRLVCHCVSAV